MSLTPAGVSHTPAGVSCATAGVSRNYGRSKTPAAVASFPYGRSEPYTPAGALISTAGTAGVAYNLSNSGRRTPLDRPEVTKTPAGGHRPEDSGREGKREMDVWLSDGRLATPCELGVQPVV